MRRITITIVSLLTLLIFAGCSGNLFMEWDKPEVPSVGEINDKNVEDQSGADDFLDDVGDWYDSDMLSGDKDTSDAVVGKLKNIYDEPSDSIDPETKQEAAALAGKIAIQSDPNAEQLSKNLIGSYDELSSTEPSNAEEFLKSLIPQEALDDIDVFTDMVHTLLQSADAYLALGESIGTDGPTYLTDAELGDAAQLGTVSVAIAAALDSLNSNDGTLDGTHDQADIGTLYNIVTGESSFSDITDVGDPMDAFVSGNGYDGMVYLLDAAGLSFS